METLTNHTETDELPDSDVVSSHLKAVRWVIKLYEELGTTYGQRFYRGNSLHISAENPTVVLKDSRGNVLKEEPVTGPDPGFIQFDFDRRWGSGYVMAIRADGFDGQRKEFAVTQATKRGEYSVERACTHNWLLDLIRKGNNAFIRFQSDAPFKLRNGVIRLYIEGDDPRDFIPDKHIMEIDTKERWGVGLRAVYYAEDVNGKQIEVVSTPTTALSE